MNDDKNQTDDSKDQTVEPVVPADETNEEPASSSEEKEEEGTPANSPVEETPKEAPESPVVEDVPTSSTVSSEPTGTDQQGRQLYTVKCSTCGKDTQVPFKPTDGRPVYCKDDFMKMRSPQ